MAVRKPIVTFLVAALTASLALAAGGGGGGGSSGGSTQQAIVDPEFAQAVAEIGREHYEAAIKLLESYVSRAKNDASAENWLGYSYRKLGSLDAAFAHYDKALAIDPRHRGAHEYVGEAYLMVGNLAKAEEHLKVLDKLCWLPCEEFTDLKKAVAAYKASTTAANTPAQ